MKRRTFIKNTIPLAFSPLVVESMIRQKVSKMLGIGYSPEDFKERKLIIVNLFGGNDGLNTAVPLDQYSLYANHRPNIKIAQPSLINLDGTLASNKQLGLHPSMPEFKSLYDEGKLNVIQSVGYPTPNFSHFRSDSLIFGGLDGQFTNDVTRGWMSNYLASTFPSFNDQPTSQLPHPLGIQIGLSYKHNGFIHEAYNNLGININNLARNNFYGDLSLSPSDSEYKELLQYLNLIEEGSQLYKQNIEDTFNGGNNMNGSTAYPDSNLGKQLKSIARMINGGLDTKILVAYKGGWDSHVNQVDLSNTNLGKHANNLEDVSKSIYAFQRDMEGQGFDDKVIILVISEFGRQMLEDGDGTNHGSLAPWFVIGTPIKGGVSGRNIDLSLLNGNHTADVLQHDYRRILSTIIQDWFGNTNTVLEQIGLGDFSGDEGTADGKLDIIDDSEVVTDTVDNFSEVFIDEFQLVEIKTENGWTYYGRTATSTVYVFAIEHNPDGGNTQNFTPQITISDLLDDGVGKDYYQKIVSNKANFVFGKMWNIVISSGNVDDFVNMRFFVSPSRLDRLNQLAINFQNESSNSEKSNSLWIKTVDSPLNPSNDFNEVGATKGIESVGSITQGVFENQNYYQFDNVINFDNRGGAICHIVTDKLSGFEENEMPGTIIFTEGGKLYGYNGTKWVKLLSF